MHMCTVLLELPIIPASNTSKLTIVVLTKNLLLQIAWNKVRDSSNRFCKLIALEIDREKKDGRKEMRRDNTRFWIKNGLYETEIKQGWT